MTLRMPGNAYSKTFEALSSLLPTNQEKEVENDPETVNTLRQSTTATKRKRMEVWWNYNLKTECFSHKAIARHVRRCGL
jgi:hypothetical protein